MRIPAATTMALATLAALLGGVWASGCTGLSTDCDLNLTCPPTAPPPPPPMCSGFYIPGDCDTCLQSSCCQELADCAANGVCLDGCIFGLWPAFAGCDAGNTKTTLDALKACMAGKCSPACNPKDMCNPVTNVGCGPAEACDAVYPGMFACIPGFGMPAQLCAACNLNGGPYCGPGLRCDDASQKCARYCCNDMDCGTGRCELDPVKAIGAPLAIPGLMVGVCVTMAGTGPSCDAPMMSSSMGTCVTDFP
jgi:hypothetical protein